jgi:hypothetical protein
VSQAVSLDQAEVDLIGEDARHHYDYYQGYNTNHSDYDDIVEKILLTLI